MIHLILAKKLKKTSLKMNISLILSVFNKITIKKDQIL